MTIDNSGIVDNVAPTEDKPTGHVPSEDAKKIYSEFVADLRKRQLSSSENFDKSILTYSSGGLAASLAFLKDFVPVNAASSPWLLYASWALFSLATVVTIASFLVSYQAQERKQTVAERYYILGDESAFTEGCWLDEVITWSNYVSGGAFALALIFTTLFVSINLNEAADMKTNRTIAQDGINTPLMQKIGNADLQKGLPSGTLQKIPPSPQPIPAQPPSVPTGQQGKQ